MGNFLVSGTGSEAEEDRCGRAVVESSINRISNANRYHSIIINIATD